MKIGRLIMFVGGLLALGLGLGWAQDTKVDTLEESVEEAIRNNWSLKAKGEKVDQARFVKNQARADFLPKLSTDYGYTRWGQRREIKTDLGTYETGSLNNYRWQGSVKQPLFKGFAVISNYRLAELGIDLSEMNVELQKMDLAFDVKSTYFSILTADRAVEVADKAVEALSSHLEVARNLYNVGMIPINDLLQSEVELGNAQVDLVKAKNQAQLARAGFNTILSRPVNAPVAVKDVLVHTKESVDFQASVNRALKERPEVKLIDINLQQTEQQIKLARSPMYPEVAFSWDYIKEGDTPGVHGGQYYQANRWEATVGLSWTFWEWGKTYYAVKEQESVKTELIKTRMALGDNIQLEVKEAVLELDKAEKNIPITQKATEQGEENLRVSEERYKAQVGTSTEVLDAQRYLTTARVNHFRALYEYHLAQARLLRAMGSY